MDSLFPRCHILNSFFSLSLLFVSSLVSPRLLFGVSWPLSSKCCGCCGPPVVLRRVPLPSSPRSCGPPSSLGVLWSSLLPSLWSCGPLLSFPVVLWSSHPGVVCGSSLPSVSPWCHPFVFFGRVEWMNEEEGKVSVSRRRNPKPHRLGREWGHPPLCHPYIPRETERTLDRTVSKQRNPPLIKRWSLARALSVSPHPGADGLVQDAAHLTWILTVLTSLAWYLGALPGKEGPVGAPYHVATTCPCGRPGSSSFASHWRFLPCGLDGTTVLPRVCHPGRKGVCTHAGLGPSRARRRLLKACLGDPIPGHLLSTPRWGYFSPSACRYRQRMLQMHLFPDM